MPLTILLDLDGTLLDIQMDTFLPAYFQALAHHLAPFVAPEVMLPALMRGTRQMFTNRDPRRTLRQTFNSVFFPLINHAPEALQAEIDRFYEEVFPTLRRLTRPRPEAQQLVEWALRQGHRLAVTTNPIFPRRAIEHRLSWAGFSPQDFVLITSYEDFHFTKPAPEYYAEVLGRLGWPEDPVILIGDDWELDIQPALALSFTPYWVHSEASLPADPERPVALGALNEALSWLQAFNPPPNLPPRYPPPTLLALLRATPAVLAHWVATYSPTAWQTRPSPQEWAAVEVLAHLRDVDRRLNLPRTAQILTQENPLILSQDSDTWIEAENYRTQPPQPLLDDFISARLSLLETLDELTPEKWARPARHVIFGPITLQDLINLIIEHDRQHLAQAYEALNAASR